MNKVSSGDFIYLTPFLISKSTLLNVMEEFDWKAVSGLSIYIIRKRFLKNALLGIK